MGFREMSIGFSVRTFAAAAALVVSALAADAATYNFVPVTNSSSANVAVGTSQMSVDVVDSGNSTVSFTFANTGLAASSITDLYWDDQAHLLNKMTSISGSSGTAFSQYANPGNLPGGNSIGFSVSPAGASADSNSGKPGVMKNGINPGEWLTIVWSLLSGASYADVISALNLGGDQSGSLRIGTHVQGFANGGSESFVNGTPAPVPVPAAGVLLIGALGGLAALRGKKRAA
jgi:hypothetical protein